MTPWHLMDCIDPADGPDEFPTTIIHSEGQLREELDRLSKRAPSIVGLSSLANGGLEIGIGGPFAGLTWGDRQRFPDTRRVVANRLYSEQPIDFQSEGDHLRYWADELIPVEQAIEVAVYFFDHRQLPEWVGWREWDRNSHQWIIHEPVTAASVPPAAAKV